MKSVALLFFLLGIIFIVLGVSKTNSTNNNTDTKQETRYISNSFMDNLVENSDINNDIFSYSNLNIPDNDLGLIQNEKNTNSLYNIHNLTF
tara:strand:- start:106 stop:378 length:273 start_codon:yes stop_codon:yes gene_type:complete